MAFDAAFGYDFCLYCDASISRGAYCSETCRQADRKASHQTSSRHPSTSTSTGTSWTSHASAAGSAYSLPNGFVYPPRMNGRGSTSSISSRQASPTEKPSAPKRSSVTSIDMHESSLSRSLNSYHAKSGLSEAAIRELKGYENSFDQTRQHKMRAYSQR